MLAFCPRLQAPNQVLTALACAQTGAMDQIKGLIETAVKANEEQLSQQSMGTAEANIPLYKLRKRVLVNNKQTPPTRSPRPSQMLRHRRM